VRRRCADEAGKAATIAIAKGDIDGYVSVGTTRTAAGIRVSMYLMHASRMMWLEVYDDVCGKQANRVLYAGEGAETGSEEAMHNKPGREVLRYSESARWVD
jgi:hypothetical protein